MNKFLVFFLTAFCGIAAQGQIYTSGQIIASNSATYIPATNAPQISTLNVAVPQHVFQIGNQNFANTNAITFYAYLNVFGSNIVVPLTIISPAGTNLSYVPSATNITDQVTTMATNFNVNIQWLAAATNQSSTNLQVTINQKL